MSIETIYKCDHCGTRCSGDERATIAEWKEPTTITFGKAVHGCSKEHLGIALAKMFGIGVNGEADELLNRKQRELTKLTDANNFLVTERDNMRARLAELEARMPANEVTNAERVQYETTIELQRKRIAALTMLRRVRDRVSNEIHYEHKCLILDIVDDELAKLEAKPAGKTPECFLCGKGPHDHTMMVLESLPEQFEVKWCNGRRQNFGTEKPAWWDVPKSDHAHKLGSCSFCDKQAPNPTPTQAQKRFKYNRAWLSEQTDDALFDLYMEHVGFFDMNGAMVERANMIETLATIEQEQAITLPTKPTMPLRERLEELATYWEKGAAYEGMPEQYRRGLKDCAKELREELAKLSAEPNNVTTPKFFANENELRGSYFCTQFPFRPFLHIGHDIEFDDIPRILKLGRNDVIEVRVVERAKS